MSVLEVYRSMNERAPAQVLSLCRMFNNIKSIKEQKIINHRVLVHIKVNMCCTSVHFN